MAPPDSDNPHLHDELLIVRHSGEIPEVALHGSIFFLTRDPDGPGLEITPDQLLLLQKMVVARYQEIIHRDLDPNNRDKGLYRGLARCIVNWQRLQKFCHRAGFATDSARNEFAAALVALLKRELRDVATQTRIPSINCSRSELDGFIRELRIKPEDLPAGWHDLCLADR